MDHTDGQRFDTHGKSDFVGQRDGEPDFASDDAGQLMQKKGPAKHLFLPGLDIVLRMPNQRFDWVFIMARTRLLLTFLSEDNTLNCCDWILT